VRRNRRAVPAPVEIDAVADEPREQLGGRRVALGDDFLQRLSGCCALTDVAPRSLAESGRDWWPLSIRWALSGAVPARPGVVARPATTAEVADVLRCCNEAFVPVTAAGGRSGVCGGVIPVFGGVSLDCCGLEGIEQARSATSLVDVRAGTFGDDLEQELRSRYAMTVGHWPQSVALATIGGSIACRGAGQYSTRYGKIEDMVAGLEVVLADGTVVRTGQLAGRGAGPRSAMGPDLTNLFVGSEGTLGVITSARLRAHPVATEERRAAWAFPSFPDGLEALRRTLRRGATPAVLRLYDATEAQRSFDGLDTNLLIALDEGDGHIVEGAMEVLCEECHGGEPLDAGLVAHWLTHRNDMSLLESVIRAGLVVDTIEVAAPWDVLAAIYEAALAALQEIPGTVAASAHQSHAYLDGACLYFTFAGLGPDPSDDAWAEAFYRRCWQAVLGATSRHGGSISHHHGIGLVRGPYLPDALGAGFDVLRELKTALDPRGILNPGKLGLPSPFGPAPWPSN
jgi:alkyldihydroxyacetonephosphate synthase